jgi:hypothetical protein
MAPFDGFASPVISLNSHFRAAPMPRVGLVVSEAVCRVPKLTSVCIADWIRFESICFNSSRVSWSVVCGTSGTPTLDGGHVAEPQFAKPLLPKVGE